MLTKEENDLLTRVEGDAPMGGIMRRHWLPICLSEQVAEPDCDPIREKILGETLVVFRDSEGKVGVLDEMCPHRKASLVYGRNEECGLRCSYHGWKFDVDGNCVDLPTSPPESSYKDTIKLLAYPVREWADIVWVYMGPREAMPELPQLEVGLVPPGSRYVTKKWQDCNWVQSLEGAIDTSHFSFLHMVLTKDAEAARAAMAKAAIADQTTQNDRIRWVQNDPRPKFQVNGHDAGLVIGGARKTDGADLYWRIAQFLMPNHAYTPTAFPGEIYYGQSWVPVDDTTCWIYTYSWQPERPFTNSEREKYATGLSLHAETDDHYVPVRNIRNDYLLDREKQKTESFTGITGVSDQDAAIQDSQGPIQDRTREHLGPTDVGIVEFRKMVMAAARALQSGTPPKSAQAAKKYAVRAGGWMSRAETDFADVMTERFGHRHGYVGTEYGFGE